MKPGLIAFLAGELKGLRGEARPIYRSTTTGSRKWDSNKHNTGCVWRSPDWFCICSEFNQSKRRQESEVLTETDISKLLARAMDPEDSELQSSQAEFAETLRALPSL